MPGIPGRGKAALLAVGTGAVAVVGILAYRHERKRRLEELKKASKSAGGKTSSKPATPPSGRSPPALDTSLTPVGSQAPPGTPTQAPSWVPTPSAKGGKPKIAPPSDAPTVNAPKELLLSVAVPPSPIANGNFSGDAGMFEGLYERNFVPGMPVQLGPTGLPSKGSQGHDTGECKRCCFFPKGRCTNGYECEFCHFDHEKRMRKKRPKPLDGASEIALGNICPTPTGGMGSPVRPATPAPAGPAPEIPGAALNHPEPPCAPPSGVPESNAAPSQNKNFPPLHAAVPPPAWLAGESGMQPPGYWAGSSPMAMHPMTPHGTQMYPGWNPHAMASPAGGLWPQDASWYFPGAPAAQWAPMPSQYSALPAASSKEGVFSRESLLRYRTSPKAAPPPESKIKCVETPKGTKKFMPL